MQAALRIILSSLPRGALLPNAYLPQGSTPDAGSWSTIPAGTGAKSASPATAALTNSSTLPQGLNADTDRGITCTGMALDATRSRLIISNDGRNKDGNYDGTPNTGNGVWTTSLVFLDTTSLAKTGEVSLIWPGDVSNNRGVQGVAHDTWSGRDLYGAVVPSLDIIAFFHPVTGAYVDQIALPAGITQPNGLAILSDGTLMITSNATLNLHQISRAGALLHTYVCSPGEKVGLDHLFYNAADNTLLFTAGANAASGAVYVLDLALDRVTKAATFAEAKAIEGVVILGTDLLIASDGYFHSVPPGNVAAPYNVNALLKYPASSLVAWRYDRVVADYDGTGDRVILDKGAGTAAGDYALRTTVASASGSTASKKLHVEMRTTNGDTVTVFIRGDATIQNVVVGPSWQVYEITASMVSAPTIQLGLRQGNAPYNTSAFADIVVRNMTLNLA